MNGMKIVGTVLAVSLMIFIIAPIASAQTYVGILQNQWFKVTLGVKGYQIGADAETVLGKGSGSAHVYFWMDYDDIGGSYTIVTCMEDDINDGVWYQRMMLAPLSVDNIYGATYPQIWDFHGNPIQFYSGAATYNLYPIFYTKITAEGATLKNATISNVACAAYVDLGGGESGIGSCTLKGSLVPADKVATAVPSLCRK